VNQGACPNPKVTAGTIRGLWLVKMSVVLAVLLEVAPAERNVLGILLSLHNIQLTLILLAKAGFITLIVLPLVIYLAINGLRGLKHVWGRATFVGVVIAANLAVDLFLLRHTLFTITGP
jgi:hypothetical protein